MLERVATADDIDRAALYAQLRGTATAPGCRAHASMICSARGTDGLLDHGTD